MKSFKYIVITIAWAAAMAGCDKNDEALCDARDINIVVSLINKYLADPRDDWGTDKTLNDLQIWLEQCPCIQNPHLTCWECVIISVADSIINPLGYEYRMDYKGKEYALYVSAKKPFRIVDYTELPTAEPDIVGVWKLIGVVHADGDERWYNNPNNSVYEVIEYFSNGSLRFYYGSSPPLNFPQDLRYTGTYNIDQDFIDLESGPYWGCHKYSFLEENRLKLDRCVPLMPGWTDDVKINTFIYQRIKLIYE